VEPLAAGGYGTTEYNELVALVQGVQSAASNFQLVTDTQYAKIQAKTQITKDYYDAVSNSGESGRAISSRRLTR
jgi:hypothetical protein